MNLDELASQDLRAALASFVERMETYAGPTDSECARPCLRTSYHEEATAKPVCCSVRVRAAEWARGAPRTRRGLRKCGLADFG
jgi:hypothetical protein